MRFYLAALATVVALSSAALYADPIPYPNPGTIAPTVAVTATGSPITAYFFSVSAGDNDTISIWDATTNTFLIPTGAFPNHTSTIGSKVVFTGAAPGDLNSGDSLVFELFNSAEPTEVLTSDPADSSDGINHAYITPFSGAIPNVTGTVTGTYVGMEDLLDVPAGASDLDYNDDTFVFSEVSTRSGSPTPEPSSFILLGTGLLGVAGMLRRKFTV